MRTLAVLFLVLTFALGFAGCGSEPADSIAGNHNSGVTTTPGTNTPVAQPTNSWATVADVPEAVKAEARAKLAEIAVFLDTVAGTASVDIRGWRLVKDGDPNYYNGINPKLLDGRGRAAEESTDPDMIHMFTSIWDVHLGVLYRGTVETKNYAYGIDFTKLDFGEVGYDFGFVSDNYDLGYAFDLDAKKWTYEEYENGDYTHLTAVTDMPSTTIPDQGTIPVAQPTNSWATVADVPEAVKAEARAKLAEIAVFLDTVAGKYRTTPGNYDTDGSGFIVQWQIRRIDYTAHPGPSQPYPSITSNVAIRLLDGLGHASESHDPDIVNMFINMGSRKANLRVLYYGTVEAADKYVGFWADRVTYRVKGFAFEFVTDSGGLGYNFDFLAKHWVYEEVHGDRIDEKLVYTAD